MKTEAEIRRYIDSIAKVIDADDGNEEKAVICMICLMARRAQRALCLWVLDEMLG